MRGGEPEGMDGIGDSGRSRLDEVREARQRRATTTESEALSIEIGPCLPNTLMAVAPMRNSRTLSRTPQTLAHNHHPRCIVVCRQCRALLRIVLVNRGLWIPATEICTIPGYYRYPSTPL